jgi:hypothetical protein
MRVKLMAMLGNVRIPLQVDIGAGDAVVPAPEVLRNTTRHAEQSSRRTAASVRSHTRPASCP